MTIVITLKYVALIMRADNRGEGGIMALMSLAQSSLPKISALHYPIMLIGVFGAALFYGDSVITPAVSVLSAIEGLEVATPAMKPYVVPITVLVLIGLYAVQSRGTAGIGKWFGPIMIVWFVALSAMGIINIVKSPEILAALNPVHAFGFLSRNGMIAFIALGAIVLAFTGAEALYADMGHFGAKPIRVAWTFVVFPALTLNYLGQGALLLSNPAAISNPFFQQLGAWSIYPLVVMSTIATVIASQATISGTFSMTKQAISLGLLPRMKIIHTSDREIGQIYIPVINGMQLAAVVLAVVEFGSSDELAAAYGIAVTGTMLLTTVLAFFVIHYHWKYPLPVGLGILQRVPGSRRGTVFLQHAQVHAGRLVPDHDGHDPVHRDADLAHRTTTGGRKSEKTCDSAGWLPGIAVPGAAGTCAGHGNLPARRNRRRTACHAAQPQAQPRAARARGIPDRHHARRAVGAAHRPA